MGAAGLLVRTVSLHAGCTMGMREIFGSSPTAIKRAA